METTTMGKVLVTAKIESLEDLFNADKGLLPAEQVKSIEVADALVDTGSTSLLLPARLITQLGLKPMRRRQAETIAGPTAVQTFCAVRLTIQGRDCVCDVGQIPDHLPVIIGQVPLELLDWVVDTKNRRLIGNPAHGGEFMMDALGVY